jgi:hypothetical protein
LLHRLISRNFGVDKVKEWLLSQFEHFNVLMLIVFFLFSTILSKSNITKLLKEQSQELYGEFEEIKDVIREERKK